MNNKPIRLRPRVAAAEMQPSNFTNPDDFTSDDKTELNDLHFATEDERILTGVWECAPCREEIDSYPAHELMSVISGSVTVTDDAGEAQTFTAGDVFFIPKGTRCVWEITETLRKIYMIAE